MGKRGPPPKPTGLLKISTPWRAKLRDGEPEPPPWDGDCPPWLDEEGQRVWAILSAQLSAMGVLGATDVNLLARYCQTWSRWRTCDAAVSKDGLVVTIETHASAHEAPHPAAALGLKYAEQLTKLEQHLGLTPAARATLAKDPKKPKSEDDRFFGPKEQPA